MATLAPTSRVREQPAGDEEAAQELNLGEFDGVVTLSLSEARLLINAVTSVRKTNRSLEDNEVFKKSMDYLDLFARYKNKDNIEAIEQILSQRTDLQPFERSQLANLGIGVNDHPDPESAIQEAKALIPSLEGKIADQDLLQLLQDLEKLRVAGGE